jgi:hypothetical protein
MRCESIFNKREFRTDYPGFFSQFFRSLRIDNVAHVRGDISENARKPGKPNYVAVAFGAKHDYLFQALV